MAMEQVTEEVGVDPTDPTKKVIIGEDLDRDLKTDLIAFLKSKADQFSWTHRDMTGISPEVITHKLNIDTNMKPVQ